MRILVLGDIVGRPGRTFLADYLAEYRQKEKIDFCIANGENAAGGAGITAKTAREIQEGWRGCHYSWGIMSGTRKTLVTRSMSWIFVCRPANLPDSNPGRHFLTRVKVDGC